MSEAVEKVTRERSIKDGRAIYPDGREFLLAHDRVKLHLEPVEIMLNGNRSVAQVLALVEKGMKANYEKGFRVTGWTFASEPKEGGVAALASQKQALISALKSCGKSDAEIAAILGK